MQEQPVDVLGLDVRVRQRLLQHPRHLPGGKFVHILSGHADGVVRALHGGVLRSNLLRLARVREFQALVSAAVANHLEAQDASLVLRVHRRQHHRPCAVAEEDARVAVGPVHPPRERVSSDHHRVLVPAAAEVLPGRHSREQEARARRREVERHRVLGSDHVGHVRRVAEHVFRRAGGDDDEVDVGSVEARVLQRLHRRPDFEVPQRFSSIKAVAGPDASPRHDPLVSRLYDVFHVLVANDGGRSCLSDANRLGHQLASLDISDWRICDLGLRHGA
mmetsp:Transcript_7033/g.16373  ORF Transcript_7033/g.16373 Transcript_7033/m.16373 type:complete len:276 (+) Transcript_7033:556-1383(+)